MITFFSTRRYTYSFKPKRHSQQSHYQQFQGPSNQQTHNFVPQVPVQPVASSSYQQSSTQQQQQQWIPGNPNVGQSTQYSPYSPPQPPIMQNRSSSFSHQRPLPPKTSNTTSQLATALGPQPNASSLVSFFHTKFVDNEFDFSFCFRIQVP